MPTLTFHRQKRADDGVRTGVEVDGRTLAEDFQEGSEEHDPALLWYIDLRCEGDSLPTETESVLDRFRRESEALTSVLHSAADEIGAGVDSESLPHQSKFHDRVPDAVIQVAVSAMRRVASRNVAEELHRIADDWQNALDAITANAGV